jgi:hypothetical protein
MTGPISFLNSLKNVHRAVTLTEQVTYSEPNPSVVDHKKISDIKHLHPFKHKVTLFVLHFIYSLAD